MSSKDRTHFVIPTFNMFKVIEFLLKIIGVIQARMHSTRLPGKAMLEILGKPILWHIYNRLSHCKKLSQVVISTGEYSNNSEICDFAQKNKIPYFSGSEKDLIDRLYKTSIDFNASALVRITADCPLVDPKIIDVLIDEYMNKKDQYDIVRNYGDTIRTFPHGLDAEIYSVESLKKMWNEIKPSELREWFPLYVKQNPESFRILEIQNTTDQSANRWTVDYEEDYQFVQEVYKELYADDKIFYYDDIMELLNKRPDLKTINSKYVGYHNLDAPKI